MEPDRVAEVAARLRAAGSVFAEDEAALLLGSAATPEELEAMVAARAGGVPVEHVVGWAEFCGVRVTVAPGVFVPRRRSEFVVDVARRLIGPGATVLDLCCGSGALGLALARAVPGIRLHAADIEPAAVRCATANLAGVGEVHLGDMYDALSGHLRGRFDLIVANAPYVPTDELASLPREARLFEPLVTLDGGEGGLAVQRRVVAGAAGWLARGGHLVIETGRHQAEATGRLLAEAGQVVAVHHDAAIDATVVTGTSRPAE